MANYRPRSLNELGNLYDKSLEAENEIKKSATKLEEGAVRVPDAFSEEETAVFTKKTPEQIASDELINKISDFNKNFGTDTAAAKAPLAIATVQSKPRAPKKKAAGEAENAKSKRVPVQKEAAKPKLVRNTERTDLFENYMKVMNDEDDDDFFDDNEVKKSRFRKKKADKKADKKLKAEETSAAEAAEEISVMPLSEAFDNVKEEVIVPVEVTDEKAEVFENPFEDSYEDSDASAENGTSGVKNPVLRIVLTVALLAVLLLSVVIGSVKAFSAINTDKAVLGKNQFYSAERNYQGTTITKGDLVVVQNRQPLHGEMIVYRNNAGAYGFVTFDSVFNAESYKATDYSEELVVFTSEYKGVVVKTVPVAGTLVALCNSYFLPIMAVMFFLIGLLILLIFFTSKAKPVKEVKEEESEEEDEYSLPEEDFSEDEEAAAEEDLSYEQSAELYEQYAQDEEENEEEAEDEELSPFEM